ncbi:MAG: aminodeoxychorismate synthase component I [Saprospiraceae bacterium]|nr:aminodeoxychorismate synthase component I [Saprospiraceae bacterium]
MNSLGGSGNPFFFLISFDKTMSLVSPMADLDPCIRFKINEHRFEAHDHVSLPFLEKFEKDPFSIEEYTERFNRVKARIEYGDSYLVNLTFPTPIDTNLSLRHIYGLAQAKYKLLMPDNFVVFSPECFVKIADGHIYSYPMKGTIDAGIENAEQLLLEDEKELAEHYTIVDLIRNDLGMVADRIELTKFRYLDTIRANDKTLLQTSSEIRGRLPLDYASRLGNMLDTLLPAGSISGAPKKETLDIIREAEKDPRGFYTGVFGFFDGKNMDSAVAIRYIEEKENQLLYRSGGGITAMSTAGQEYNELIDKIYVPTGRKHLDS